MRIRSAVFAVAIAATAQAAPHDQISRADFNRWAVRENLPVYWIAGSNNNKRVDPDEIATLLFYPTSSTPASEWVAKGQLTPAFETAYAQIVAASKAKP